MGRLTVLVLCLVSSVSALAMENGSDAARDRIVQRELETLRTATASGARPYFVPLPPGAVKPEGWLRDWARTAAKGITGHLDERAAVYREGYTARDFQAMGVQPHGMGWPLEQCAYWLDGLVRLAYILDDEALAAKAKSRLNPVVDGVLAGGESFVYWQPKTILKERFNNWAHSHMGRALVAYYQATGDQRILDALIKVYRNYPLPKFQADFHLINGMVNLDAMLDTYLLSGDRQVLANALESVRQPEFAETVDQWNCGDIATGHGVIFYEHIRVPALMYPWTSDRRLLDATLAALRWHDQRYLLPSGLCSSEEYQAGVGATRNIETCNVAAAPWTYHWLLRITGQREFGDRMEQIFFNAGPAPVDRDFQTMSYYQCSNRLSMSLPDEHDEPARPRAGCYRFSRLGNPVLCCVGNLNRVIPNYIMQMWMATFDDGLAATLYGPCRVRISAGGVPVTIHCATDYPFDTKIKLTVTPKGQAAFPLYLRIPEWCDAPSIKVNGAKQSVAVNERGFAKLLRGWNAGDTVELEFPMQPKLTCGRETPFPDIAYFQEKRNRKLATLRPINNPFASVTFGPLLFALAIPDRDPNTPVADAKWNYALDFDPDKLAQQAKVAREAVPSRWQWQLQGAPVRLSVPAREFDWKPTDIQPLPESPIKGGRPTSISLVPYGCTKFRVSMFPVTEAMWTKCKPASR